MNQPNAPSEHTQQFSAEQQLKIVQLKNKLEVFTAKLCEKFAEYILSVALVPPRYGAAKQRINLIVIVNDQDRRKLSRAELKKKISAIVTVLAKDVDASLDTETVFLSELWNNCTYGNYSVLDALKSTAVVYDRALITAIKFAQAHKQLARDKFEQYIVSYILTGAIARGDSAADSPIHITVIVDDTDVRSMHSRELTEKLRVILAQMSSEVIEMLNIQNTVIVETALLSEVWHNLLHAEHKTITLVREGIPLYDRGVFTPWKNMLAKGYFVPSAQSSTAMISLAHEQIHLARQQSRVALDHLYEGLFTAGTAVLLHYGISTAPSEIPTLINELCVKHKILEQEHLNTFVRIRDLHRHVHDNPEVTVNAREIDELTHEAERCVTRMERLIKQRREEKQDERITELVNRMSAASRSVLSSYGIENVNKARAEELVHKISEVLVSSGKLGEEQLATIAALLDIGRKKRAQSHEALDHAMLEKLERDAQEVLHELILCSERAQLIERERNKMRIKHGTATGEVFFGEESLYIIDDCEHPSESVREIKVYADGSLGDEKKIPMQVYIEKTKKGTSHSVKEKTLSDLKNMLKNVFQGDIELFLN